MSTDWWHFNLPSVRQDRLNVYQSHLQNVTRKKCPALWAHVRKNTRTHTYWRFRYLLLKKKERIKQVFTLTLLSFIAFVNQPKKMEISTTRLLSDFQALKPLTLNIDPSTTNTPQVSKNNLLKEPQEETIYRAPRGRRGEGPWHVFLLTPMGKAENDEGKTKNTPKCLRKKSSRGRYASHPVPGHRSLPAN